MRAAAKATANSAAAPTSETMMNPTKAGLMPKVSAAFCTDSTKISLTSATSTVTASSVPTASPIGQCASSGLAVIGACEQFLVGPEREPQAKRVSGDQQD